MELQEAIEIVSYKMGIKLSVEALDDPILDEEIVRQAISDDESGNARDIDAKTYMTANKMVMEHRKQYHREAGEKWLSENAKKEGVHTTDSGLQYKVVNEGAGAKPDLNSIVTVDYEGTLVDGVPFDSSYARGIPAEFPVGKVIKGWQEGLQLMSAGAKYQFFIPQELGYGERGAGSDIPPFSALIFEVELHSIAD